ncbi:hypothetical protein BSKO_00778 [Bryopsis sp. KO-2023]|nr:hypothetical protein BSKO_00778 [Bryopsis sp. KO-2023]
MTGVLGEEEVRQIMDGSEVDLVNEDEENFLAAVDEELRQRLSGVVDEEELRRFLAEGDLVDEDDESFLAAVDEELRQSLSRSMEVEERRRIMVERELVNEDEENYSAAADEEVLDGPEVESVNEDEENFLDVVENADIERRTALEECLSSKSEGIKWAGRAGWVRTGAVH